MVCYKAGDKSGGMDLEEKWKRPRSALSLPVSLTGVIESFFFLRKKTYGIH